MKISEVLGRLKSMETNSHVAAVNGGTSRNMKALSLAQEIIDRAATDVLIHPAVLEEKVASTPRHDDPSPADLIGGHVEFASTPRQLANDFADGTFPHNMGEVRRRARTEFEVAAINLIEYCYPCGHWRGGEKMKNLAGYVAKLREALPTTDLPPFNLRTLRERWIPSADLAGTCMSASAYQSKKAAERSERGFAVHFREVL